MMRCLSLLRTDALDEDDDGDTEGKEEDAATLDGRCKAVEGRQDKGDDLVKIEQEQKGCCVYGIEDGFLHI